MRISSAHLSIEARNLLTKLEGLGILPRLNLDVISAEPMVLADLLSILAEKADPERAEFLTRLSSRLTFLGDFLALLLAWEGINEGEAMAARV